jgi:homoserine O-acetyltransferase
LREETLDIGTLALDGGSLLPHVEQRVTIYGNLSAARDNVVLVCHALTGSSRAADWWPGIVGQGALFDPEHRCIVCINALGSAYGSSGPASFCHAEGSEAFPRVTVRDMVRAQSRVLDVLGIERVEVVIGGSLGGMQALQWALDAPERAQHAIVIGAHDHHSPMGIALNALQRECLELDPVRGLRTARKIAMLSYKSEALFNERHGRRRDRNDPARFDIEGYLDLQADRFAGRMDAASYATLTHAMDAFDVRDRQRDRRTQITFVGISSDWLFRPEDVAAAAARLDATFLEISSAHGHDAFLAEPALFAQALKPRIAGSAHGASVL